MSSLSHHIPVHDVDDENDQLRELLVQAGVDAQAHTVAAKLQTILIGELHHRVKNNLAIVAAIVAQSLRGAADVAAASATIASRLHALGLAHDLLVRERWTGAGCRSLIENAIIAFQTDSRRQFDIAGDNLSITSGPAVALSMLVHELCTNAVKYGALSVPDGRVSIVWSVDGGEGDAKRFKLRWKESGGPDVVAPQHKSFGTRFIEQALPGQLQGEARLSFEPDGVICEVNIPVSSLQEH
jgi:two-component sensor histidine kinase